MANAKAEQRAKLRGKIERLEQRIDEQQKKAQEWLESVQKRQTEKRELVKTNAANLARAVKDLVKTPS